MFDPICNMASETKHSLFYEIAQIFIILRFARSRFRSGLLPRCISAFLLLIIFHLLPAYSCADQKHYYFYNPSNYFGSDGYFNPLNTIVNGSYDILRNGGHNKDIFSLEYNQGWRNVWANISDPVAAIKQFGWRNFHRKELFNITLDSRSGQFVPNVTTHILGEGMLYVMLAEWYDYHRYPLPKTLSCLTTTFYQVTNEVVENGKWRGVNTDPIADLLIFNPLGILLFSFDYTKRFFSETVSLHYWGLQPAINLKTRELENAGQQFIMKKNITQSYSVFFYWGINGLAGLSWTRDGVHNYALGAGTVANKLNEKRLNGTRFLTPTMDGAVGFFYDRRNSLLISLLVSGPRMYNLRANIYPGFFSTRHYIPGFYLGMGEWDKFNIGISFLLMSLSS